MKKVMQTFCAVCLLALVVSPSGQALASPLFSLDTFSDWDTAVGTTVAPVTEAYPALAAYGTEGIDYVYATPQITAMDAATSGLSDGLLMTWGDTGADPAIPQVAAWEYTYPIDPDLTGKLLHISVHPPSPGILAVSLTLNDQLGGWASWTWTVNPTLIPNAPNPITIDPTLMGAQAASATFLKSAVFDVTKVVSIQADELAVGSALWNTFPSGPPTTGTQPWNYWSTLSVTPEPTTVFLLGLGALALRRRK
jgi:hypothetical protein